MGDIINMQARLKLIREAREAREKRQSAANKLIEYLSPHKQADGSYLLPGGIDDMFKNEEEKR